MGVNFKLFGLLIQFVLIMGMSGCSSSISSQTPLNIDVLDLLITPNKMPSGWKVEGEPTKYSSYPHYQYNLGGGSISFRSGKNTIEHFVVRFNSVGEAGKKYATHEIFSDSDGLFPIKWEKENNLKIKSEAITQYQIVCMAMKDQPNQREKVKTCGLESQYENYISVVIYSTTKVDNYQEDLKTILEIIDQHISSVIKAYQQKQTTTP